MPPGKSKRSQPPFRRGSWRETGTALGAGRVLQTRLRVCVGLPERLRNAVGKHGEDVCVWRHRRAESAVISDRHIVNQSSAGIVKLNVSARQLVRVRALREGPSQA